MSIVRAARLLATATALALLAGACGDEGATVDDTVAKLAAAQAATEGAGSARAAMTFEISSESTGDIVFQMTGVVDLDSDAARLSGDLSGMPGAGGRLDMIIVDGLAYVRAPGLPSLSGDRTWIKTDLTSPSAAGGSPFSQDPSQSLMLLSAVKSARAQGRATLRGEPTTRYEGVIDPSAIVGGQGDQSFEALRRSGVEEIPFKAWIDGDGRVRKLEMSLQANPEGGDISVRTMFELWDFGLEVDIRPPPESKVQEAGKLGG